MKAILVTILYLFSSYCVCAEELSTKDPGPQALKAKIEELRKLYKPETVPNLHEMLISFMPEKPALESALADHIPIQDIDKLIARYNLFRTVEEGDIRKMVEKESHNKMDESIIVIPATVDDLAAYKKDGDIYKFFSKGSHLLALDGTLNPSVKFYHVVVKDKNNKDVFVMDLIFWFRGSVIHEIKPGWRSLLKLSEWIEPQESIYPPPGNAGREIKEAHVEALKSRLTENNNYLKKLNVLIDNNVELGKNLEDKYKIRDWVYRSSLRAKRDHCEKFSKDLEARIKVEEMAIKISGYQFLEEIDVNSIKKNVEIKTQIDTLEAELKDLRLAKESKLKIILSPGQLSKDHIEKLKAEVNEIDASSSKKEAKVSQLKLQLKK